MTAGWEARAACRGMPLDVFFEPQHVEQARRVCSGCEVRRACHDYSVEQGLSYGVWGGRTGAERAAWIDLRGTAA